MTEPTEIPPTEIPGYVLERPIATGGTGEVFRAHDASGHTVAIKRLRPELAMSSSARRRFVRESALTRELEHPAIVRVIDAGLDPRERPFIVYEWISGRRIADLPACSTRDARRIALELLDALAYAHHEGVVHRDLSAANVLVQHDGRVRVIDFGLAHMLERSLDETSYSMLSRSGVVLGTPPYLAPEQVEGWDVDPRADLWAVGALVFRLVTGRAVFRASTPTLTMFKCVSEDAPSLREHAPHVSESFAAVVAAALERDRDRRWQTAVELSAALAAVEVDDVALEHESDIDEPVTRSLGSR